MPPKSFLHPHKGQDFIIFGDDYCCIHIKWFLYVILSWPHRLSLYSGYCKPCCDKNAYQRVAIAVSCGILRFLHTVWRPITHEEDLLIFYILTFNLKVEALGLFTEVCMVCGVLCTHVFTQCLPTPSLLVPQNTLWKAWATSICDCFALNPLIGIYSRIPQAHLPCQI